MKRWMFGSLGALSVVFLLMLVGCFDKPASVGISCAAGGELLVEGAVRYCAYGVNPAGVQESGFVCPADFPVFALGSAKWLCFRTDTDKIFVLGGGELDVKTPDATTDATTGCTGSAPPCHSCSSDSDVAATCISGVWSCPQGMKLEACQFEDYPSCELYGAEVCCDQQGNATPARCPSPSQPLCKDGSPAQKSCSPAEVRFLDVKTAYVAGESIAPRLENGTTTAIQWGDCGGFFVLERQDPGTKEWAKHRTIGCSALVAYTRNLTGGATTLLQPLSIPELDGDNAKYRLHGRYFTGCPTGSQVIFDPQACSAGPIDVYSETFAVQPKSLPSKQKVTFQITTKSSDTFFVVSQGFNCGSYGIADATSGTSLTLGLPFQCGCECPAPPSPQAMQLALVDANTTAELVWDARSLVTYGTTLDCAAQGWPGASPVTVTSAASHPVAAGKYKATIQVITTLPQRCKLNQSDPTIANCELQLLMPPTFPSQYNLCGAETSVTVEFTLPESGDIVVPVELP